MEGIGQMSRQMHLQILQASEKTAEFKNVISDLLLFTHIVFPPSQQVQLTGAQHRKRRKTSAPNPPSGSITQNHWNHFFPTFIKLIIYYQR
jgi:hypothetical protein